jgi:hypothetical protein
VGLEDVHAHQPRIGAGRARLVDQLATYLTRSR